MGNWTGSVQVSFNVQEGMFNSLPELDWRYDHQKKWHDGLRDAGIDAVCDGGGSGFGQMDIFFFTNEVERTVDFLKQAMADEEVIGYAVITSMEDDAEELVTHWDGPASYAGLTDA